MKLYVTVKIKDNAIFEAVLHGSYSAARKELDDYYAAAVDSESGAAFDPINLLVSCDIISIDTNRMGNPIKLGG